MRLKGKKNGLRRQWLDHTHDYNFVSVCVYVSVRVRVIVIFLFCFVFLKTVKFYKRKFRQPDTYLPERLPFVGGGRVNNNSEGGKSGKKKKNLVTEWKRTANKYCWSGPILFSAGVLLCLYICVFSIIPSFLSGAGFKGGSGDGEGGGGSFPRKDRS